MAWVNKDFTLNFWVKEARNNNRLIYKAEFEMDNLDLLKVYEFYNKAEVFLGFDPCVKDWFKI